VQGVGRFRGVDPLEDFVAVGGAQGREESVVSVVGVAEISGIDESEA
jgi:hypothetical protein